MKVKIFFGLITFFASAAWAAVPADINSFVAEQNQNALIQKQQNATELRNFNSSLQSLTNKNSTAPTNNISLALQTAKMNNSVPKINCNGKNDEYNYPSNYVYNENQQKIYRLHPFAKCIVNTPVEPAPISTQPDKVTNSTETKSTTTQWNINY